MHLNQRRKEEGIISIFQIISITFSSRYSVHSSRHLDRLKNRQELITKATHETMLRSQFTRRTIIRILRSPPSIWGGGTIEPLTNTRLFPTVITVNSTLNSIQSSITCKLQFTKVSARRTRSDSASVNDSSRLAISIHINHSIQRTIICNIGTEHKLCSFSKININSELEISCARRRPRSWNFKMESRISRIATTRNNVESFFTIKLNSKRSSIVPLKQHSRNSFTRHQSCGDKVHYVQRTIISLISGFICPRNNNLISDIKDFISFPRFYDSGNLSKGSCSLNTTTCNYIQQKILGMQFIQNTLCGFIENTRLNNLTHR